MSEITRDISNKKPRLGRGLGSLLSGASAMGEGLPTSSSLPPPPVLDHGSRTSEAAKSVSAPAISTTQSAPNTPVVSPEARIWQVALDKLQPSEFQPRTHFEKGALEELASSIRQNGILQPIVARRIANNQLEIIAGERRWRAAQLAGLHEVPVILKTMKNQQALELAIIENIQREDLNPIEEAEAYLRLTNEFQLTQQQVAEKVGKERATVANTMRLLNLAPAVREMLSKTEISAGHAKVLLSVLDERKQVSLAQQIKNKKLSVRQTEKLAQQANQAGAEQSGATKEISLDASVTQRLITGLAEELQKTLGTKVNIDYLNSKGKISVHFYSDEELTQIIERLKAGCRKS